MAKKVSKEKKVKKITASFIISWISGLLFLLVGVETLATIPLIGIIIILCSVLIIPKSEKLISEKFNFEISGRIKFILILIIFTLIGSISIDNQRQEIIMEDPYTNKFIDFENSLRSITGSNTRFEWNGNELTIVYIYEHQRFVDEYLNVLYRMSDIYKESFASHNNFLELDKVTVITMQSYNDVYGHSDIKELARSSMDKSTARRINWNSFEKSNLDEVIRVQYSGDSFYYLLNQI